MSNVNKLPRRQKRISPALGTASRRVRSSTVTETPRVCPCGRICRYYPRCRHGG